MKDVCSQGGSPVQTRGFFKCRCPHFLVQKLGFFEIYGVSAWTRVRS